MSNTPKPNGHAPEAKVPSQAPSAVRMRRSKERRARGAIVTRGAVVERDLISALVQCGWLNPVEAQNREAVEHALYAVIHQAIAAGMRPAQASQLFVPVDQPTLQAAWVWAKPNAEPSVQNAGRALCTAIRCAEQAGFCPDEYATRIKAMMGMN